tara:strand:- start:903 stop:1115 length:213 start_codon:yes stop_codon:yes gene_type:complete
MDEDTILDIWALFSDYIDKKQHVTVAGRFVDLLADLEVDVNVLKNTVGNYEELDTAIDYFLDEEDTEHDY